MRTFEVKNSKVEEAIKEVVDLLDKRKVSLDKGWYLRVLSVKRGTRVLVDLDNSFRYREREARRYLQIRKGGQEITGPSSQAIPYVVYALRNSDNKDKTKIEAKLIRDDTLRLRISEVRQ